MGPTLFFKATLKPEGSKMLFSRLACLYLSQDLGERAPACLRIWIGLYCHTSPCGRLLIDTRELITQRRRRRRREQQKSNRFRLAKQQLYTRIALFCTFLRRRFTTTTWNCLISRFVEDVNEDNDFLFLFLNFDTSLRMQLPKNVPTFDELNELE